MAVIADMCEKICRAVLSELNAAGVETKQIAFQEMQDRNVGALVRPAVNISINSAVFKKITLTTYKCITGLTLYLMVSDPGVEGEERARFMVLSLIEAMIDALFLKKLGLELELQDPLLPLGFNNVTDEKYAGAGYQLYELKFSTSFNFEKDPDADDEGLLASIVTGYFLQDPIDDGVADLQGSIAMVGVYGGNSVSTYRRLPIYGGYANSKFGTHEIYGGTAKTPN